MEENEIVVGSICNYNGIKCLVVQDADEENKCLILFYSAEGQVIEGKVSVDNLTLIKTDSMLNYLYTCLALRTDELMDIIQN